MAPSSLAGQPAPLKREEIGDLASIIMVLQRRFMASLMGKLARDRISFPQFFLLSHLCAHGACGISAIGRLMGHSIPAATGLVQRMEKLGYLRRTHGKEDRRTVSVSPTKKGALLLEGIRQEIISNLETKIMDKLSPAEQRAWLDIYGKIHDYCLSCCHQ